MFKRILTRRIRNFFKFIKIFSDSEGDFLIPECNEAEFAIYAGVIGHLLSYYISVEKNLPIGKPRNLAKSVTVK